jgi:hypothetical protein
MIVDRAGKSRGYAFAEFEHERDMLCRWCVSTLPRLTVQPHTSAWMVTRLMASVLLSMLSGRALSTNGFLVALACRLTPVHS